MSATTTPGRNLLQLLRAHAEWLSSDGTRGMQLRLPGGQWNLSYLDLVKVDFRHAALQGVSFAHADLRNADLRGANVSSSDFRDALLEGARFDGAVTRDAWFSCLNCGATTHAHFNKKCLSAPGYYKPYEGYRR